MLLLARRPSARPRGPHAADPEDGREGRHIRCQGLEWRRRGVNVAAFLAATATVVADDGALAQVKVVAEVVDEVTLAPLLRRHEVHKVAPRDADLLPPHVVPIPHAPLRSRRRCTRHVHGATLDGRKVRGATRAVHTGTTDSPSRRARAAAVVAAVDVVVDSAPAPHRGPRVELPLEDDGLGSIDVAGEESAAAV